MPNIPRPPGHHTITPGFQVPNAARVIEFLEKAFGGKVVARHEGPGGSIMHAEVMIGDSVVMLGDGMPGTPPMPAGLSLYVDDGEAVDATFRRAIEAGATAVAPPQDQFYGYRTATIHDMGGNKWTICAIVEEVSEEEMSRRMAAVLKGG